MKYFSKHSSVTAVAIAIFTIAVTALPSLSETKSHNESGKETDYGDGIKMVEAPDQSGFVITTEDGTTLSFTSKNQQVVFTQNNGIKKVITFVDHSIKQIVKSDAPLIGQAQSHHQ